MMMPKRDGFSFKRPTQLCLALCSLLLVALALPGWSLEARQSAIGYHPNSPKRLVLEGIPADQRSRLKSLVIDPNEARYGIALLPGKPVLTPTLIQAFDATLPMGAAEIGPSLAGPSVENLVFDLSPLTKPGDYQLQLSGLSMPVQPLGVKISEFLFWDSLRPTVRSFYLYRAREPEYRAAESSYLQLPDCPTWTAPLNTDPLSLDLSVPVEQKAITGGWYNGPVCEKTVMQTAPAAAYLSAAYAWSPKPFEYFKLDYPNTEVRPVYVPDILHEAAVGLEWLIRIQQANGAIRAGLAFEPETNRPVVKPPTLLDTATGTASLALAARVYKKPNIGFTVDTLLAAERGWEAIAREEIAAQSLREQAAWFWAAVELYLATGKPVYQQAILQQLENADWPIELVLKEPGSGLGIYNLLLYAPGEFQALEPMKQLRRRVVKLAQMELATVRQDPYGSGMYPQTIQTLEDLLDRGLLLVYAYRLTGQAPYRDAAAHTVYYLQGLNHSGAKFITPTVEPLAADAPISTRVRWKKQPVPGIILEPAQATASIDGLSALNSPPNLVRNGKLAFLLAALNAAYNTDLGMKKK
ncbi:MAG: glycoside hydrolase family 9 protein [Candidatus Melainabacteria bacterium]|nr:glycoside hydrolase family 9 protein [Candidatus Melainabacteria bacterium]